MSLRITPMTGEMVDRVAARSGLPLKKVREVFQSYWDDIAFCIYNHMTYSLDCKGICTFYLMIKKLHTLVVVKEKLLIRYRNKILKKGIPESEVLNNHHVLDILSDLALLLVTIKHYETYVLTQYPKRHKPNIQAIEATVSRVEKLFDISMVAVPIQVRHTVQEIYVQKLSQLGLLQNPVHFINSREEAVFSDTKV